MTEIVPTEINPVIFGEVALWLLGLILLVRLFSTETGRGFRNSPGPLGRWRISFSTFVVCAVLVFSSATLTQFAVASLDNETLGDAAVDGDLWQLVLGTAFQGGMLIGALISGLYIRLEQQLDRRQLAVAPPLDEQPRPSPLSLPKSLAAGVATFALALPLIVGVTFLSNTLIDALGLPNAKQEMVELFIKADSPAKLLTMTILAVIVAPLAEEFLFRAGLFRYLRTRIPRIVALLAPAMIFAVLHVNWKTLEGLNSVLPLVLLAVIFSLAYERTGRLVVPIVGHALFNLHTLLLLASGITT